MRGHLRRPAVSAAGLRLTLLGGFRLSGAGHAMPQPGGQRLLAALATYGTVRRRRARELLWPGVPEPQAQARLRSSLWRLTSAGTPLVTVSGDALRLPPGTEVDLRRLLASARRLIESTADMPGPTVDDDDDLEIVASPGAELLPGWYDDWVLLERERVRHLRLQALEALAERECARGRHAIAIDAALAAIRLEPLRETAHHVLLRAYLGENNVAEAARHLRRYAALLRAELGVEPSPSLTALLAARGVVAG